MPPPTPLSRGEADSRDPVPRAVVHPARRHHAQYAPDDIALDHPPTGAGVDSPVGERGTDDGQIVGGHADRALPHIEIHRA